MTAVAAATVVASSVALAAGITTVVTVAVAVAATVVVTWAVSAEGAAGGTRDRAAMRSPQGLAIRGGRSTSLASRR